MKRVPFSLNRRKASATIFSLFFSAVILTLAIAFNLLVRENLKTSLALKYKADAFVTANSALHLLLYHILSGTFTQKEILLPNSNESLGINRLPLNGTEVELRIPDKILLTAKDTNGLLSLSYINVAALKRLILRYTNNDTKRADIIIDSLLDWIDRDDLTRLNGAEKDYYQSQNLPYHPRNYPLQYKEEFAFIRGMDRELYNKLEPFITILPANGFNPNTAPDEVLLAYLDLEDPKDLLPIKNFIQTKPLSSDTELMGLVGRKIALSEEVYYFPSRYIELTLKVPQGNRTIYTLKIGLDLRLTSRRPYEILYYREE